MKRDKLEKMGRRRFVKVASAMGMTASSLRYGTQEGLAKSMDSPEDEISYVAKLRVVTDDDGTPIGHEPIYKTISREEWADLKATEKASEKIATLLEKHFPNSPTLSASIARMEESPTGFGIRVKYREKQKLTGDKIEPTPSRKRVREVLPDKAGATVGEDQWSRTRSRIPVHLTEKITLREASGYSGTDWSDIPAGCVVNGGTSCSTFYHEGYSETDLLTAGHVVGSASSSDEWGNPSKSQKDGWVEKKVEKLHKDIALLRPYSSNLDQMLRNDSDSNPQKENQIYGIITNDEIKSSYIGGAQYVQYQGHVTGQVQTRVYNYETQDTITGCDYPTQVFQTQQSAQDGDSGGVVFDPDSDGYGVWIMGLIFDYGENSYGARCNTAELIENTYNGYIH